MTKHVLTLAAIALALGGCYATTIRSGLKAEPKPSIEHDAKWHHGLVWGLAELSGPYDLREMCPHGWAEISTETSFVNGIVDIFTSGIYSPQTVSVRCAVAAPAPAAASTAAPAE